MKTIIVMLAGMVLVTSCAQITTTKSELAGIKAAADSHADVYTECVVNNALSNASQSAIGVDDVVDLAQSRCAPELDKFKGAQQEYLASQVMMTEKPLQQSVDALEERASIDALEALLAVAGEQPAGSMAPAAGAAAAVSGAPAPQKSAAPVSPVPASGWNAQQRIYLDCMEDQANKYAGLNESASVVADVAQGRCKSYMAGPGESALEQEGRTMVMGAVLDAKLQGAGR